MARPKAKRTRKAATKRRVTKLKRGAKPTARKKQGPASPGRAALPKGSAQKKKSARSDREPSGRKPATRAKASAAPATVQGFPAAVKYRIGGIHAKPPTAKQKKRIRGLSKHPDAVRARRYRREKKAIAEALEVARLEKLERRRQRDRERRERERGGRGGGIVRPVSDRELAEGWLGEIRDHCAAFTPTSLDIVPPHQDGPTIWMSCGRFDLLEPVDYATLGAIFQSISDDYLLEARIHPDRLSQIRIIYSDPDSKRGEGDSIVSKIAGWSFALGDIIGEILGGGSSDEGSLAVRYDKTAIGTFYVFFSAEITKYTTVFPTSEGAASKKQPRTQTIKLR